MEIDEIRKKRSKKKKLTKKQIMRISIFFTLLIAIIIGIFFLINNLIPVKNVDKTNILIKLSNTKITGKSVIATLDSKTNKDIYYFIDYSVSEENYYEEDLEEIPEENTVSNNTAVDTSKKLENTVKNEIAIKEIGNSEYHKVNNSKIEIKNNGIVYLKYKRFNKFSEKPYVFEISNIDKTGPEITELTANSTDSSITVTANAVDENSGNINYFFKLSTSNTYISTGSTNNYTFKDLEKDQTYIIYVKASDKFGNESEAVTEATTSLEAENEVVEQKVYHFEVNLGANTVTVYDQDENGEYKKPVKAFICSTGKATPKSGTYKISNKYRWRSLFGNVYGQYAVRITGNILFHSVPYEKMYPNTLEYEEYDKLGTSASMGCIRLCVRDAKWIYDNAKSGSTVKFYSDSSNPGPLGKPTSQKISSNKANRNWDPTDPDTHNPWLGGDGKVSKLVIEDDDDDYSNTTTSKPTNNTVSNNTTNSTNNNTSSVHENTTQNNTTSTRPDNSYTPPVNNTVNQKPNENTNTTTPPPTNTTVDNPTPPPSDDNSNNTSTGSENNNTITDEPEPEPPVTNTTVPEEPEPPVENVTEPTDNTTN